MVWPARQLFRIISVSDDSLFYQLPDDQLLAIVMYLEAGTQGPEGLLAVANVVTNRVLNATGHGWFDTNVYNITGSSWKAILLAKNQFSCLWFDPPNGNRQKALGMASNFSAAVENYPILETTVLPIAQAAISGMLADNTGGATFYRNPARSSRASDKLFNSLEVLGSIGAHVFYTDLPLSDRLRDFGSAVFDVGAAGVETVTETISDIGQSIGQAGQSLVQGIENIFVTYPDDQSDSRPGMVLAIGLGLLAYVILSKKERA